MRIAGRNLPSDKNLIYGLRYIRGLGLTRSKYIIQELNLDPSSKVKDLTDKNVDDITKFIEDNFVVEGDLSKEVITNIKHKIDIKCYQGLRHRVGLPVRGQRTKTNSNTGRAKKRIKSGKGTSGAEKK